MEITSAISKVREHCKSEKFAEVNFMVDSSAIYSLVPGKILDQLDIDPYKEISFSLEDGKTLKKKYAVPILNMREKEGRRRLYMEEMAIKLCLEQQH